MDVAAPPPYVKKLKLLFIRLAVFEGSGGIFFLAGPGRKEFAGFSTGTQQKHAEKEAEQIELFHNKKV
jgi:hypothetical protein